MVWKNRLIDSSLFLWFFDFEVDADVQAEVAAYEKTKGESLPPTSETTKVVSASRIWWKWLYVSVKNIRVLNRCYIVQTNMFSKKKKKSWYIEGKFN